MRMIKVDHCLAWLFICSFSSNLLFLSQFFLLTSWKTKLKYIDPQDSWIKSYCLNSQGLLQTSYFDSVYILLFLRRNFWGQLDSCYIEVIEPNSSNQMLLNWSHWTPILQIKCYLIEKFVQSYQIMSGTILA